MRQLVRGQVRIYNQSFRPSREESESPRGKFQIFFEIDMLADYDGRVQEWWLTKREIEVCKQAFIEYWNWTGETTPEDKPYSEHVQSVLGDYPEKPEETPEGVVLRDQPGTKSGQVQSRYWGSGSSRAPAPIHKEAVSKKQLAEQVSENVNKPVKQLTIEDLVVGMSAEALEEIWEPQGVIQEKAMVIDVDTGEIDWVDTRSYEWVWNTRDEDLEKARKELKKRGITR